MQKARSVWLRSVGKGSVLSLRFRNQRAEQVFGLQAKIPADLSQVPHMEPFGKDIAIPWESSFTDTS